jgi:predicted secreted protein
LISKKAYHCGLEDKVSKKAPSIITTKLYNAGVEARYQQQQGIETSSKVQGYKVAQQTIGEHCPKNTSTQKQKAHTHRPLLL